MTVAAAEAAPKGALTGVVVVRGMTESAHALNPLETEAVGRVPTTTPRVWGTGGATGTLTNTFAENMTPAPRGEHGTGLG